MKAKYTGPAKPVPVYYDPFPDAWLMWSFGTLLVAFVFIVFVMGW